MSVYYKTSQCGLMYFAGAKNRHVMLVFVTFLSSLGLHTTCSEQIKHREKSLHGLYSDLSSWIPMNILVLILRIQVIYIVKFCHNLALKDKWSMYDFVCGSICQTVESYLILWEFQSYNISKKNSAITFAHPLACTNMHIDTSCPLQSLHWQIGGKGGGCWGSLFGRKISPLKAIFLSFYWLHPSALIVEKGIHERLQLPLKFLDLT